MLLAYGLKAQTGGPGQPEFMQFQQAGTSNLVNPSSGSFSYQIPLFSIGGYPMTLTYQSGIQMEDVASMVGLGWNLNAGSIVRTLRGLPDDFNGDPIIKEYSVKPNETFGGKLGVDLEIAGLPPSLGLSVGAGLGVFYNNYKGWGLEPSLSGSASLSAQSNAGVGGSAALGMGVSVNSQSGVDKYLNPSIGLKLGTGNDKLGISLGKTWSVNSNEGLKSSMNAGLSYVRYSPNQTRNGVDGGFKVSKRHTDQSSMSILGLSSSSYLNNSFQPDIDYPFLNSSGTYSGAIGWDAYYVDPSIRVTGYFSKQTLATTIQTFAAYGSMYESNSIGGNSMMDFNREKKLPYFIGESKILPIPFKTPDVFNLNGQGLSMTFSVSKNDIGLVGDAEAIINSNGNHAGAEVNLGALFKAGANFGTSVSFQKTGKWNPDPTNINFKPEQDVIGTQLYQQFCFKNHGEINKFNYSAFALLGGYNPVQFNLYSESSITRYLNNGSLIDSILLNTIQPVRQSTISYLTAIEADKIGFDKQIKYYNFNNTPATPLNRTSDYRKGHHLSEISVTQPDGMKYVFGIPVYNTTQKEVSFNVTGNAIDAVKNLVHYTKNVDNTSGNSKGIDHFFESTTTPAYVTQFLITAVLSPDYRDITNDGITEDDLGNYVKFSYYKEDFTYNWRTPFAQDHATYNKSLRSDDSDDKGTYVYGEKELWYIRSIESKTEIAEFHYSQRPDGFGVIDENGGKNSNRFLRKLDYIEVYSLPDRIRNGNNATPIKTIHFDYTNLLCKNIENGENANTGKLTLHKVAFTYEHSKKGKLTPYVFEYGKTTDNEVVNPAYDIRSVNRWGYFQKNNPGNYSDITNSPLSNIDFPYALQTKSVMDKNASAWNLTDITIPGGGRLKVAYEANDYAYIQNKTAGQMFLVTGISTSPSALTNGNTLYGSFDPLSLSNPLNVFLKNRIYFSLTNPITNPDPVEARRELEENYIKDIRDGYLYYKFYVNLSGGKYEYITGYAKVKDYGVVASHQAFLDLESVPIDDENPLIRINPILKTAFQFMRINRNSMVFNNNSLGVPANFGSFIESLPNIINQLGNQIGASEMGVNLFCATQNYCKEVSLDKSFIRLYNPVKRKIAGGSRVKEISIDDNWNAMTGNTHQNKSYTTSYDYTTEETNPLNNSKVTISSGVADYEPLVGGDEISLKQPIFYSDKKKMAPDNDYFVEEPVNESLFPAPQITYGKVTQITNETNLNVAKTGKIVNEFFTAKDYPVKVARTAIDEKRDKTQFNPIQLPFVAIDQQHDFAAVSQGYSIELNNMSGLPKATWVYNQNGDRVSGEVSEYFPNNDQFTTIDHRGRISHNNKMGLSAEYTIDGKKSYDQSVSTTFNANFNLAAWGFVTIPILMPLYSQMTEEKQFQSIVVNKVIHRNGLLKSKTVYEQSSSVTTENLAFDEITGEVLLSKLTNEFNDTLYSFKYPAWWMYKGMGPSYANTKLVINSTNLSVFKSFLKVGDELRPTVTGPRLWVNGGNSSIPTFVNDLGSQTAISGNEYQVYNSGAKNLLSASAGHLVTWNQNPLANGIKLEFGQNMVLNSSAIEYYDDAVMYCDSCATIRNRMGKNGFLAGKKGNFKPKRTWFFLEDRSPVNLANGITNIKEQGLFKIYTDFWRLPLNPSLNWTPGYANWEWKEKVNLTDVDGQTIETEDRIGRKTANLLGYKNTLITAQATNAAYGETYFDGFEDYYNAYCPITTKSDRGSPIPALQKMQMDPSSKAPTGNGSTHQNVEMKRVIVVKGNPVITDNESHTGKYSLEVKGSLSFTISSPVACKGSRGRETVSADVKYEPIQTTRGNNGKPTNDSGCIECIGGFSPEKNKKYIFSCWVKVNNPQPIISCSDASVEITCNGSASVSLKSEGPVIEGWQRIMGAFSTSSNNNVSVTLKQGNAATYFDDLRIFPADGNMVSYVYDDINLRLTYSLDENNYFTKNEYNNQGELIRIKKETEKGIITIKEVNSSLVKH
jgi:hypothetical protein